MAIKADEPIVKHPGAEKLVNFNLKRSTELASGEALVTVDSVMVTPSGDLTVTNPVVSGLEVQMLLKGGTAGTTYTVEIAVTTDQGQKLVYCGDVSVEECG